METIGIADPSAAFGGSATGAVTSTGTATMLAMLGVSAMDVFDMLKNVDNGCQKRFRGCQNQYYVERDGEKAWLSLLKSLVSLCSSLVTLCGLCARIL
jgi:hypothetical protein